MCLFVCVLVRERERERVHGSKFAVHLSGSCIAMFRSTPAMGGPLTSVHKQGWPRVLTALQHASLGGMGLKGATAALQGTNWTSAAKNVLPQGWLFPCCTKLVVTRTNTNIRGRALELKPFMFDSISLIFLR